ncbi:hypothetical protein LINPERHAP1_LOCUS7950 [Linum perenne]
MITLTATATVPAPSTGVPRFARLTSIRRRCSSQLKLGTATSNALSIVPIQRFTWFSGPDPVVTPGRFRVLCSRGGESDGSKVSNSGFSQGDGDDEDLWFLLKLGGGSFVGAAAIKYGSIVFPEITTPNLTQALLMISLPVVLSVFILFFYQSPPNKR